MKRENIIGRANVEDTPELETYYRELEGEALGALWTVANEIEPWYPQPKSVPTPNGTWHDHGVEASGTQCIWQDGLDIPLMNSLDANFYEVHPQVVQTPAPLSRENWSKPYSPQFQYRWDDAYRAVKEAAHSPSDGRVYEYQNPLTGGPIMPTIGAQLQLLAKGEETRPHQHTGSVIYQVAQGSGWSEIGGERFDWEEKDIFALPSWAPHRHGAYQEAVLFSFSDIPAMKAL